MKLKPSQVTQPGKYQYARYPFSQPDQEVEVEYFTGMGELTVRFHPEMCPMPLRRVSRLSRFIPIEDCK